MKRIRFTYPVWYRAKAHCPNCSFLCSFYIRSYAGPNKNCVKGKQLCPICKHKVEIEMYHPSHTDEQNQIKHCKQNIYDFVALIVNYKYKHTNELAANSR